MPPGKQFRFVCDPAHVKNMLKVIAHNSGEMVEQKTSEEGIYFTVVKKDQDEEI